ncbi:hypothetical protein [Runella zeae]|uniref:hypothetical protein n=1 Tax=Runella zeae TaxID=94255 RepID=UPI002353256F|nr:hypothetical protein [Runella zeae]
MKKISCYFLSVLFCFSCATQKQINYIFPKTVEDKVQNYVQTYLQNKPQTRFYLTLDKIEEDQYSLQLNEITLKSNDITSDILKNGNRFTMIAGRKIPVINSNDLIFIDLGKSPRGGIIRKATLNHGYGFYFTYHGEILKEMK